METVFQEQHQEAGRRGGIAGVLRLWWETIVGIFKTAPGEHVAMFAQDASFALRMMRKNPGFTLAAVLTLGLESAPIRRFSALSIAVLLKPLPYAHGDRLVTLQQQAPRAECWVNPSPWQKPTTTERKVIPSTAWSNTTT